jgi:hypothetical protein
VPKIFKKLSSTLASLFSIVPNGKILIILLQKINGKKKGNSAGTMAIATQILLKIYSMKKIKISKFSMFPQII